MVAKHTKCNNVTTGVCISEHQNYVVSSSGEVRRNILVVSQGLTACIKLQNIIITEENTNIFCGYYKQKVERNFRTQALHAFLTTIFFLNQ